MLVRPWLIPFVVLFWCITSGWLIVEKIIPSLAPGAAPGHQAFYAAEGLPVAWTVLWNEQPLGWAMSQTHPEEDGGMKVDTMLHFDRLPVDELLPSWTKALLQRAIDPTAMFGVDARGELSIDSRGVLRSFRSAIDLPAVAEKIVLNGTIDKGDVTVLVSTRDLNYSTSRHLPTNVSLGDELSPQANLPGLFPNRRWTVPVYSPLRPGQSPIEVLHAHVIGEESLFWDDSFVRVHVVHYRDDPSSHHDPRCRLWVDRSGKVLKQESVVLGSKLVFVRRTDEGAERLLDTIGVEASDISPSTDPEAARSEAGDES